MNKTHLFIALLSVLVCLMFTLYLQTQDRVHQLEQQLSSVPHDEDEAILLDAMDRFQRFGSKLWFAGEYENWELASFYVHEIEEVIEELESSNILEEGQDIAELASRLPAPALMAVEKGIHAQDRVQFQQGYHRLVSACNACHVATKKPFIQIGIPHKGSMANQVFQSPTMIQTRAKQAH
ncbi:MAG: hypothetical protein AAF587_06850 [Bacteroidota bacterium]